MALQVHPRTSDLTPEQVFESENGILYSSLSNVTTINLHYWITTRSILPPFTQYWQEVGYNILYFTPFSTEAVWIRPYPYKPVNNTIYSRPTNTAPSSIPTLSSPMSTSSTPSTPPKQNYWSNAPANPTTGLIALMHQTIQQNATMISHHQTRPSTTSVQPTSISPS